MDRDRWIRGALWVSVAVNLAGLIVFGLPALGRSSTLLPIETPRFLAAQLAFTIALFGCVYAWLAVQPRIHRPLVVVGGLGKLGFFALTVAYWAAGDVPMRMALNATPDLILAGAFLWWARAAT